MRKYLALMPALLLVACMTAKPDKGPYLSMDCNALETERLRLVAELDMLPPAQTEKIAKVKAQIEAVGAVQVEKGCAG